VNLTDLAVSGPLLLAGLLALTRERCRSPHRAACRWSPATSPTSRAWSAPSPPPVTLPDGAARPVSGRWRVPGAAALFVLEFTVVFASATMAVLGLSDALLLNEQLLQRLGGVITIVMGLVFLGAFPVLQRGMRPRHTPPACGVLRCSAPSTAWAGRRVWAPHSPE
jgi:cytochrome c-type biogenesis protein